MTTTVIDELVVRLGLDPKPFKKGTAEAKRSLDNNKDVVKKSNDDIGKSMEAAGKKVLAYFASFEAAVKLADWLGKLNDAAANMGLLARRTGESVHELDVFSRAVKISGGSAEEALALVARLSDEMNNAKAGGGLSPFLEMAQRLGVAWQNNDGTLRKATDVIEDLGHAAQQFGGQQGGFLLGKAGVSEGVLNYLLRSKAEQADILRQAREQATLDEARAAAADKLRQQWLGIEDDVNKVGLALLNDVTPAVRELFSTLKDVGGVFKYISDTISTIVNLITIAIRGFKELYALAGLSNKGDTKEKTASKWTYLLPGVAALKGLGWLRDWAKAKVATNDDPNVPRPDVPAVASAPTADTRTRGLRNNNPGNLRLPGGPHDAEGFSIFTNPEEGITKARDQINRYARRGINTIEGIISTYAPAKDHNNTEAYINTIAKALKKDRGEQLTPADLNRLLAAMFRVESGPGAPTLDKVSQVLGPAGVAAVTRGAQPTPGAGGQVAQSGDTINHTEIDKIEVHTAATDANGIANSVRGAIVRKNLAAQADQGQT